MVLVDIAHQLAATGKAEQAEPIFAWSLKIAETIKDDYAKQNALNAIARDLAQKGRYDQAVKVAETIEDDYAKQNALDAIASYRKSP